MMPCSLQVSTHNLERVRRIKNRMVRLNTRVETIHELLEKLLDDDDDMKDLNLTAKQLVQLSATHCLLLHCILVSLGLCLAYTITCSKSSCTSVIPSWLAICLRLE